MLALTPIRRIPSSHVLGSGAACVKDLDSNKLGQFCYTEGGAPNHGCHGGSVSVAVSCVAVIGEVGTENCTAGEFL